MAKINFHQIRANDLQATELQGSLLAKNLKLREIGISSKTFHYWKMNGLISTVSDGAWAEISYVEYLWLKVLEAMRGFGCSLKLMQKIYYEQFIKAYDINLGAKTIEDNIAYYKSLRKIRPLDSLELEKLRSSEIILNDPAITIALRTEISYFYQNVLACINLCEERGIVIYPDDTYAMLGGDQEIDLHRPHMYIPFSYFIAELFADEGKDKFVEGLHLYTQDELRLIKELRNCNVEKVTITFDKESRRPTTIEYDQSGLIQGEKAKEVMRILGLRNYSGINLKTRTGTTLSFTKTEKKFI